MLFLLSVVLAGAVLLGALWQLASAEWVICQVKSASSQPLSDQQCPPVALLLSLRGGDPFLRDCLARLIEQDYPDYQVFVALDHENDPAAVYVDQLIQERQPKNLTKLIIVDRPSACTLVNHNYVRMVEQLDSKYQFVAFVDADAVTWPSWLRELVAPLVKDPSVGGTSGNRWYTPDAINLGTLTRSAWNMGSVVQMALQHFPWGGSMALRSEVARHEEMLRRWSTSFAGDTPVYAMMKEYGYSFQFNPAILLPNRENTSLLAFQNWMARQLLNSKLYHPAWISLLGQAILTATVLVMAIAANFANLVGGDWLGFSLLGGSLLLYWGVYFIQFLRMNRVIEERGASQAGQNGERLSGWISTVSAIKLFFVIPIVPLVFVIATIKALLIRRVNWRGIEYKIDRAFGIELIEYKPFSQQPAESQHSL